MPVHTVGRMPFRPNGAEISAVVDILETDHADAQTMARVIVSALAGMFARRQTYAVAPVGHPFAYGLYWSAADAEKAWRGQIGPHVQAPARVVPMFPWAPPELHLAAGCECGHPPEMHVVRGSKAKPSKPAECGRTSCECPSYTPRKVRP